MTTSVVSSNPDHCRVYSIQHYVIKFVSDLRQVSYFIHTPFLHTFSFVGRYDTIPAQGKHIDKQDSKNNQTYTLFYGSFDAFFSYTTEHHNDKMTFKDIRTRKGNS